jgi:hypothetical protein
MYGEIEVQRHHYYPRYQMKMTWSASYPRRFTAGWRAPADHWIGVWVVPRVDLDVVKNRKLSCPCRDSKPNSSAVNPQFVAIPIELSQLTSHTSYLHQRQIYNSSHIAGDDIRADFISPLWVHFKSFVKERV